MIRAQPDQNGTSINIVTPLVNSKPWERFRSDIPRLKHGWVPLSAHRRCVPRNTARYHRLHIPPHQQPLLDHSLCKNCHNRRIRLCTLVSLRDSRATIVGTASRWSWSKVDGGASHRDYLLGGCYPRVAGVPAGVSTDGSVQVW